MTFADFGTAEVLRHAEIPMPQLRSGDLPVKVMAAGVNRADVLQRQGRYGKQHYGEVFEVGSESTDIRPGKRVMAIVGGGAYAEYPRVDRGMAFRIPGHLGYFEAAAMENRVTVWVCESALPLFADGRLKPLVGTVFPLSEAADAHRCMEAGGGFGKIVLHVHP